MYEASNLVCALGNALCWSIIALTGLVLDRKGIRALHLRYLERMDSLEAYQWNKSPKQHCQILGT